jgi:hypothetical protein
MPNGNGFLHFCLAKSDPGRSGEDNRPFVEAVLWLVRTSTPWRDLLTSFDKWSSALIVPALGSNYERHPKLQRFMIANDSTTVAVDVPVWLTLDDIVALETKHGIPPLSGNQAAAITGHIDFIQVRNGVVHILDYKPDTRANKPIAQLTLHALALARLTGISLFDIKCAWFNENEYCEFFPRTLLSHKRELSIAAMRSSTWSISFRKRKTLSNTDSE